MSTRATERLAILEHARALKMARSPHAYVGGNTVKISESLAASPAVARIPTGPPVWICGDCHLGNHGRNASAGGEVDIQIRDLNETLIGNPSHDLISLGLSLAAAVRGSDLPGVTMARMIGEMAQGYDHALALGDGDQAPEGNVVPTVRRRTLGRQWRHLTRERLADVEPRLPLGKKFWVLVKGEHNKLAHLFAERGRLVHCRRYALSEAA